MINFLKLFNILIFIVFASNIVLAYFFDTLFLEQEKITQLQVLSIILLIDVIIVLLLVKIFYNDPISELKYLIQKFYIGELKGKDINIKKSLNPNINYIVIFFGKTLDTLKNIKDEFLHGKEIKGEVSIGKEIQEKMLLKKDIKVPSLNIVAKSKPAGEIGGDSYDIIKQGENYYIYVGDATGHGVGAGFIMIMVNTLISAFAKIYTSGAQILANTNEVLKPRVKANLLMSLLLLRWNEDTKKIYMTGAGHEYLMIYKHKQKKCFRIKSGGVALGMIKNIHKLIKEQQVSFEPNDIIVLYSDGITEAINKPKRDGNEIMFGEDRLQEVIQNSPNISGKDYKSARTVFNNITIKLSQYMGYNPLQLDDITLATIEYKADDYNSEEDIPLEIPKDLITQWKW
ncbi:MAG: PP2C family protein-serine/threonine phosphatase [Candidatus Gracilibacteria bacterium]|nr:PP2C family protein-serine/threonine phosphatase [Candidatus Gracilibacteria bacterium]